MLEHSLNTEELLRYSQQIKLKEIGFSGQEKLKNARVLCVGLGGLGSPLLLYLAAAGIGRLGLVDADTLELSNLQRQVLYRQSQVSGAKTAAAAQQIKAINAHIQVDIYEEPLRQDNALQLVSPYEIVADCSDNFYTNYLINDICFQQKKAYVYASVAQFQGYCCLFHGSNGPCFRCLFPIPADSRVIPNCESGGVLGVVPGILGIMQATEIIKWILKIGDSLAKRFFMVDLLKMKFREIHLQQNADCQLCAHHLPISQLSYPAESFNRKEYSITLEELPRFLQQPQVSLIDVRTEEEHKIKNLGGKVLPLAELSTRIHELNPEHTIILYCHSGQRSLQALNILLAAGLTSVKYLKNG